MPTHYSCSSAPPPTSIYLYLDPYQLSVKLTLMMKINRVRTLLNLFMEPRNIRGLGPGIPIFSCTPWVHEPYLCEDINELDAFKVTQGCSSDTVHCSFDGPTATTFLWGDHFQTRSWKSTLKLTRQTGRWMWSVESRFPKRREEEKPCLSLKLRWSQLTLNSDSAFPGGGSLRSVLNKDSGPSLFPFSNKTPGTCVRLQYSHITTLATSSGSTNRELLSQATTFIPLDTEIDSTFPRRDTYSGEWRGREVIHVNMPLLVFGHLGAEELHNKRSHLPDTVQLTGCLGFNVLCKIATYMVQH